MNCWILQCNINDYRWFDYVKEHKNDPDTWGISLFIPEIELGDTAFIWLTKYKGKETRGIYAMAKITGLPDKDRIPFDYGKRFWINIEVKERRMRLINLELKYTKLITDKPISKDELETTGLGNLLILRMPQRAIYKVTKECETIRKIVASR